MSVFILASLASAHVGASASLVQTSDLLSLCGGSYDNVAR